MDKNFRVIFYGGDDFAVPGLVELAKSYSVVAVVTYTDRPARRTNKRIPTPVALKSAELGLDIIKVEKEDIQSEEFLEKVAKLKPDIGVVISFAILPSELINIPRFGTINVHPSLLPRYRGAAPINWAIINGEKKTGISIILISDKVDSGGIVCQSEIDIYDDETAGELRERIKQIYPEILVNGIELMRKPGYKPKAQDEMLATRAPKITQKHRRIDWSKDAKSIVNLIRGLSPTPAAFALFREKPVKIIRAKTIESDNIAHQPGEIIGVSRDERGLVVAAGRGVLLIKEIQPENKNIISGLDFWNGYRIKEGERFN